MGIFQTIFNAGPQGQNLRKKKFRYMRAQAAHGIKSAEEAIEADKSETPRGRAFLTQSLAGRGLSKSTIADQDLTRYDEFSARRRAALERRLDLARKYKSYIHKVMNYERKAIYSQLLDGVLSVFGGIGQGGGTAESQYAGAMQGGDAGAYFGGSYYSGVGAAGGANTGYYSGTY